MPAKKSFAHRSYKTFFHFLIISFILILSINLSALEIRRVELFGNTIDLEITKQLNDTKGELTNKDIEALGIKITAEYYDKGYTTSYVEKLTVRNNGVLEIRIIESKIVGINTTGLTGKEKEEIDNYLTSLTGKIYNRFAVEKTAESIKYKYNLSSIKIYPVNFDNTSDVFLSIKLSKRTKGNFYGGIGFEPIYGFSPYLGYYYPLTDSALDLYAKAGYREGKFRKAEGDLKYFLFPDNNPKGIYIGSNIARFIEHWESHDSEYKKISLSPVAGYRVIYQYLFFDLFLNEIISDIENYKNTNDNKKKFRDYDTRITLELGLSNSSNLLLKKDATGIKLSVASGKSDLSKKFYLISSGEFKTIISPSVWFRIIPTLYSYYTTPEERFFWQYVYDKRLLGFFNDYTASKWKNTAGLEIEFEIVPQFIYAGPFVNTGYFLDESLKWQSKTGGGIMSAIEFKNSYIGIYFAWDLSKGPSKGGLSIIAGGTF